MSWVAILTMLSMAAATALLVMTREWSYFEAVGAVIGVMLFILAVLLAITFLLTQPNARPQIWRQVIRTACEDLHGLIKLLTGRAGP